MAKCDVLNLYIWILKEKKEKIKEKVFNLESKFSIKKMNAQWQYSIPINFNSFFISYTNKSFKF